MYRTSDKTPRERDLEYEVYRLEEERDQKAQQEQRARKERQQERQQEISQSYRQADTWTEALRKQSNLFNGEVGLSEGEVGYDPSTDFFDQGAKACDRALEIYSQVQAGKQDEIDKLKARLEEIDMEIRAAVGNQLKSERDTQGWNNVADVLCDPNITPTEFLDW